MRALRAGELLDQAFHRLADQAAPRDRAWAQELVYGTVRLRGRIDDLLSRFVRRALLELEPDVLDILRLGAYQLFEMNSVPAYAAISQSVELTKAIGARAASGLVNGVLQSLRRGHAAVPPAQPDDTARYLSTWGSHPRWLVDRWLAHFGRTGAEALVLANNQRPDVFVRAIGVSREAAIDRLHAAEIEAQPVGEVAAAIRVPSADVNRALELLPAVVQDPAAMMVVDYAGFGRGRVADLCAAPGGKALALSGECEVVAGDISMARLARLRENALRIGNARVRFFVADARRPPFTVLEQVLIDAPCTGTGTLRRHPDGKWRLQKEDLVALVALQREILQAVAPLVAPGGLLVYATCSLEPEENREQVDWFLREHTGFRVEPPERTDLPMRDGCLHVLPHQHGFDGAFAARLRRA